MRVIPVLNRGGAGVAFVAAMTALAIEPVCAATRSWDGGGSSNGWDDRANWDNDTSLVNGDRVVFYSTASNLETDLRRDWSLYSLTFSDTADSPVTLSNGTLSLTNGITVSTGSDGAHTIDTAVVVSNNQTWNIAGYGLAVDGVVSGAGMLEKTGSGTLVLSGSNTFGGLLAVRGGTLSISTINDAGQNGSLGNSASSVTLGGNGGVSATLSYNGSTATSNKAFTMGTGTSTPGTGVFHIGNATTVLTLRGTIGGSGGLSKTGAGTLELTGANTFTGVTTLAGGSLSLVYSSAGSNRLGDAGLVLGGGNLMLSGTVSNVETVGATSLVAGASTIQRLSGLSTLRMAGISRTIGATLNLNAAGIADTSSANARGILGGWATVAGNDWATVSSGSIIAYSSYTPVGGSGTIATNANLNVKVISPGSIGLADGTTTINTLKNEVAEGDGGVTISSANTLRLGLSGGGAAVLLPVGGSALTISTGGLTSSTGEVIFHNYSTTNSITVTAPVTNDTTAVSLTKTGPGSLILTASSSYSGITSVNQGSLLVNGSLSSASATTVNSEGTLGGTGTLAGAVDVNSGGTISPGETAGVPASLTVGSLTLDTGSTYEVGIADAASTPGVGWDLLTSTGVVTHGEFTVKLTSYSGIGGDEGAPIDLPAGRNVIFEWLIATAAGGAFDKSIIGLDTSAFQPRSETLDGFAMSLVTKPEEGHRGLYISYSYSTVPEASTILLGAAGLFPLVLQRRRQRVLSR